MMGFRDAAASAGPYANELTTSTPHHSIFTDQTLFLMPNQQGESTEHTASKFSFMFTWSSFPVLLQEIGSTARVCLVYMLSQ